MMRKTALGDTPPSLVGGGRIDWLIDHVWIPLFHWVLLRDNASVGCAFGRMVDVDDYSSFLHDEPTAGCRL